MSTGPRFICRIVLSGERGLYEVGRLEEGVWHCDSVDSFDSESDALGRACTLNGSAVLEFYGRAFLGRFVGVLHAAALLPNGSIRAQWSPPSSL